MSKPDIEEFTRRLMVAFPKMPKDTRYGPRDDYFPSARTIRWREPQDAAMTSPEYEDELIRELNERLDAAEFEVSHGEAPQDRADRRKELREQMRRELMDGRML